MTRILPGELETRGKLQDSAKSCRRPVDACKPSVGDSIGEPKRRNREAVHPEKIAHCPRFKGFVEGKTVRKVDHQSLFGKMHCRRQIPKNDVLGVVGFWFLFLIGLGHWCCGRRGSRLPRCGWNLHRSHCRWNELANRLSLRVNEITLAISFQHDLRAR